MTDSQREPPVAKRVDTRREFHGDVFVDPYEWLRDKSNPEVLAYLEAENDYADQSTAQLEPLRQKIFDEIKARTKETDLSVPVRRGDWWYYARSFEGKQYGVHCRCAVIDPDDWNPPVLDEHTEIPGEQVLLDENIEARRARLLLAGCRQHQPGRKRARLLRRRRRRRAIHPAVQESSHWRAVPRRDRRYRRGSDVGHRQPNRLLRHGRRGVAPRHRVAASAGLGSARRKGVPRSRREVLARGRPDPQRRLYPDRLRGQPSPPRCVTRTPRTRMPSSSPCCRAATASNTRWSTRLSAGRTGS